MSSENLWKPLVFDIFRWLNRNRTLAWNGLTVDLKVLTSRIQKQSSFQRLQRPESRFQRPDPSVQIPASRVQRPDSRVQRPESSIQSPASRVQRPESSVQSPASSLQSLASRVQSPASNFCVQSPGIMPIHCKYKDCFDACRNYQGTSILWFCYKRFFP